MDIRKQKRKFTFTTFVKSLADLLRNIRSILNTLTSKRISSELLEKINLTVTTVNGCIYCRSVHTRILLKQGISMKDLNNLLGLRFKEMKAHDLKALLFAKLYAENNGNVKNRDYLELKREYGSQKAIDIVNSIKLITLANLAGNTFDSFDKRLTNNFRLQGSFIFELLFYWIGFPFYKIASLLN